MTDYAIQPFDPRSLDDHQWQAVCDLVNPFRLKIDPAFTAIDIAEAKRRYLPNVDFYGADYWWAHAPDGRLVGWLRAGRFTRGDENRHLLEMNIVVDSAHRRQGLGSAMLARAVDLAEREDRTLLNSGANSRVPAARAFLLRAGGEVRMRHVTNELLVDAVDLDLMQRWIERAAERAGAYEVVELPFPYPEEMLEEVAALMRLMSTAPLEDLDVDHVPWDAAMVREIEQSLVDRGVTRFTAAARHRPSGNLVGYTTIFQHRFQRQFLWQEDTAVAPEHRNLGLGRWVKAANLLRALNACPEATRIRTGNAGSNEPMLRLNHEMGFRKIFHHDVIQIPLEKAQAYLAEAAGKMPPSAP